MKNKLVACLKSWLFKNWKGKFSERKKLLQKQESFVWEKLSWRSLEECKIIKVK